MATPAARPELTVVNVIRPMAAATVVARIAHCSERASVTIITGNVQVGAIQNEVGLSVVIEQPQVPGDRVVTGTTIVSKIAAVRIIIDIVMAGDALGVGVSEYLTEVAGFTFDIVMVAEQRKMGQVMIEIRRLLPDALVVTAITLSILAPFMNIVVQMAGNAVRFR